jgi:hypothetical protein
MRAHENRWRRTVRFVWCRVLPLLWVIWMVAGCSSFNRNWKEATRLPDSNRDLVGRWQGTWRSDVNGHNDDLRCLLTKQDEGKYLARFQAKYRKLVRFTFTYTVPLTVVEKETGEFEFEGTANLGMLAGGVYKYKGEADATNFVSTYDCKYDSGKFRMLRMNSTN